jgi:hypothetical protein
MAGAPAGNKNAVKSPGDRMWESAIRRAVLQYESAKDAKVKIKRGQALNHIAMRLVEQAVEGDKDARREIGDRLDGRPAQVVQGPGGTDLVPKRIEIVLVAPK